MIEYQILHVSLNHSEKKYALIHCVFDGCAYHELFYSECYHLIINSFSKWCNTMGTLNKLNQLHSLLFQLWTLLSPHLYTLQLQFCSEHKW